MFITCEVLELKGFKYTNFFTYYIDDILGINEEIIYPDEIEEVSYHREIVPIYQPRKHRGIILDFVPTMYSIFFGSSSKVNYETHLYVAITLKDGRYVAGKGIIR